MSYTGGATTATTAAASYPGLCGGANAYIDTLGAYLPPEKLQLVKKCVVGYTPQSGICGTLSDLVYRIWNTICAIFGQSDYQIALNAMESKPPKDQASFDKEMATIGTNVNMRTIKVCLLNMLIEINTLGINDPSTLFEKFFLPLVLPKLLQGKGTNEKEMVEKIGAIAEFASPFIASIPSVVDQDHNASKFITELAAGISEVATPVMVANKVILKVIAAVVSPIVTKIAEQSRQKTLTMASLKQMFAPLLLLASGFMSPSAAKPGAQSAAASGSSASAANGLPPYATGRSPTATASGSSASAAVGHVPPYAGGAGAVD